MKATQAIKTELSMLKYGCTLSMNKRSTAELAGQYGRDEYGFTALAQEFLSLAVKARTKAVYIENLKKAYRIMEAEEAGVIVI